MITEETYLYSYEELQRIDDLISINMDSHLESLVSKKIASLLSSEMEIYQQCTDIFLSGSCEQNTCNLFNTFCEKWNKKEEAYLEEIKAKTNQKQQNVLTILEKEEIILTKDKSICVIESKLVEQNKQKHLLESALYSVREELNVSKQSFLQQLSNKTHIINEQLLKIGELQAKLDLKMNENEAILIENNILRENQKKLQDGIEAVQIWLSQDVQKSKLNLITYNILVNELNQAHQDKLQEIQKYANIHQQNKKIMLLLCQINSSLQYNLSQFQGEEQGNHPMSAYTFNPFEGLNKSYKIITSKIQFFASDLQKFTQEYQLSSKQNAEMKIKIASLEQQILKIKLKLQEYQIQNRNLQNEVSNQKRQHYNALLEVERNKRKIEDSLLQNLPELKKFQQKCLALEKAVKEKQTKYQQLILKLEAQEREKQSLNKAIKNEQMVNYELKEQILNIKSNLDMIMKTQEDDEDCNFNIVQQLIDKNNQLTNQFTLTKMQQELKEEKIAYQEKIIEKYAQENQNITIELEKLKENIEILKIQRTNQHEQNIFLEEKYRLFEAQVLQKQLENLKNIKVLNDIQTQTDPIKETIESRIKRQIVSQSSRSQVEKSHSLLSEKDENKENANSHNLTNRNLMSSREKCAYKQKIMTLNEIINYMLNYSKGYGEGEIRQGSWFMNQIAKYGSEYEMRILDSTHLEPKMKNMRFIQGLCKQDPNCSRLVKQFQSILEFYFSRSYKLSSSSLSITPITQQKLNKTVNKARNQSNQYLF